MDTTRSQSSGHSGRTSATCNLCQSQRPRSVSARTRQALAHIEAVADQPQPAPPTAAELVANMSPSQVARFRRIFS
jgi:hypothetical protein